jgi:hypothetical protein
MTNDMIDQANWYLHCQRNVENTATAKLETVATVKMNANVANACTHLNHARQEQIVGVELRSSSLTRNDPITETVHLIGPKPETTGVGNLEIIFVMPVFIQA